MWVRDQAVLPVTEEQHPLDGLATFLYEAGHLKDTPRTGWSMLKIPSPESVAEHSFRASVVAIALPVLEGADPGHAAALATMHDVPETRTGDVPAVGRAYVTTDPPELVTAHQVANAPEDVAAVFRDLISEFEQGETAEAKIAKDADKLELLMQSREYERIGYDTTDWQQMSLQALRTKSGQYLGQAIMAADPAKWWAAFANSYAELKAGAKQRGRK